MYKGEKSDYIGRIKNSGTQFIRAPFAADGKKGKSSVIKGKDLRNGKGK